MILLDSLRNILERYDTHKTKSQEIAICKNVDKTKILFMKSKLPSFHFVYLLEIQQNHHAEYTGPSYMDANPLQMVQRYFEGKNIEQLNITQLIQLERELDSTLVYTRGRKTEAMMKSVTALHQKEQDLTDENNLIEREISAIINNGNLAGQHGRVVEDPDCVHPSPLDLFHF
ncbi:agamous-like MADS-box protein AP1 [Populus alba x Populus x berolinensis]|uniref:Agamous-like MADS-box protein AP1 n=1 Tax=Populus alba x Populus x berolinensis TaxID=444605 RepID=A0AAD6RRL1_9ROSI|nr:agamous-like MADS-box protein AP1 [Populus alba x Populus x berolinensis]